MINYALGMLLCTAALAQAQAPNALTAAERAAGWRLLFDGKTMDGWEDPRRKNPPGDAWTVEDGCLKALSGARVREDLFTREPFGDFELAFDWRINPGGNSGVKYRIQDRVWLHPRQPTGRFEDLVARSIRNRLPARPAEGEEYVVAFEYQVIDNGGHADARRGPKYSAGALYDLVGPSKAAARPVGEFNHSRIVLAGQRVEHWLNGVKVVDTKLDSPEIASGAARRWGQDSPVYELLAAQPRARTAIGLQNHGDHAWFRNIKVRVIGGADRSTQ